MSDTRDQTVDPASVAPDAGPTPTAGRRRFLKRSARLLVYAAPLIETFRARRLLAQSAAGSAGFSGGGL